MAAAAAPTSTGKSKSSTIFKQQERDVAEYRQEMKATAIQLKTALAQSELYRSELEKSREERETLVQEKTQLLHRTQLLKSELGKHGAALATPKRLTVLTLCGFSSPDSLPILFFTTLSNTCVLHASESRCRRDATNLRLDKCHPSF
jgi:methylthioribose-1-phosphate isomerase